MRIYFRVLSRLIDHVIDDLVTIHELLIELFHEGEYFKMIALISPRK